MDTPLWSFDDVTLRKGSRTLAVGLHLDVTPGEIVGLAGPSGSGKTTLLRCLAGLEDPANGRVFLEGQTPESIGWPAYRRQVVLVDQQPALLDATVERNLVRVFEYKTGATPFPRDEAIELLDTLGLERRYLDQPARTLSVGEQQRVCLVRALLLRPKVLLLDEPTSGLDEAAVGDAEHVVREAVTQARAGAALWVSHNRDQLERVATRTLDLTEFRPAATSEGAA